MHSYIYMYIYAPIVIDILGFKQKKKILNGAKLSDFPTGDKSHIFQRKNHMTKPFWWISLKESVLKQIA